MNNEKKKIKTRVHISIIILKIKIFNKYVKKDL